jgi:tetratricopeptide (TPR) repeat protein
LGDLDLRLGNDVEARRLYMESLTLFREASDKSGIATALNPLGAVALREGDLDQAAAYYQESLTINQELGDKQGMAWACCGLGTVAYRQCDFDRAEGMLQRSVALLTDVGDDGGIAWVLQQKGYVNCALGNFRGAALLFGMALDMARHLDHVVTLAYCFPGLVCIASHDDQPLLAAQLLGTAEALRNQVATLGSVSDLADYDQLLAEACGTIDSQTYAAEISAGRVLPLTDAVAFALHAFAEWG